MDHIANVICGGIAGVSADLLMYPLDTLKTRSQLNKSLITKYNIPSNAVIKGLKYKSMYSGLGVLICGDFPSGAAFYGIYEFTKEKFNVNTTHNGQNRLLHTHSPLSSTTDIPKLPLPVIYFLGSTLGQISSLILRNPFEVVKQQLQAGLHPNASYAFNHIINTQGIRGLYAGFFTTLLREIPFDGIQFILWEKLKSNTHIQNISTYLSSKMHMSEISGDVITSAICGSVAGGIAGAATMPLDVTKTRLMTQGNIKMYNSTWHCLNTIAREEGSSALFRGMSLRVSWLTLGSFIFFAALESGKLTIKPYLIKHE